MKPLNRIKINTTNAYVIINKLNKGRLAHTMGSRYYIFYKKKEAINFANRLYKQFLNDPVATAMEWNLYVENPFEVIPIELNY